MTALHRSQLDHFEQWLIDDGWTICAQRQEHQALRAWKMNYNGDKKKWCILNEPVDLDSDFLVAPKFSVSLVKSFIRGPNDDAYKKSIVGRY